LEKWGNFRKSSFIVQYTAKLCKTIYMGIPVVDYDNTIWGIRNTYFETDTSV
jgi:hypothetical protein